MARTAPSSSATVVEQPPPSTVHQLEVACAELKSLPETRDAIPAGRAFYTRTRIPGWNLDTPQNIGSEVLQCMNHRLCMKSVVPSSSAQPLEQLQSLSKRSWRKPRSVQRNSNHKVIIFFWATRRQIHSFFCNYWSILLLRTNNKLYGFASQLSYNARKMMQGLLVHCKSLVHHLELWDEEQRSRSSCQCTTSLISFQV